MTVPTLDEPLSEIAGSRWSSAVLPLTREVAAAGPSGTELTNADSRQGMRDPACGVRVRGRERSVPPDIGHRNALAL